MTKTKTIGALSCIVSSNEIRLIGLTQLMRAAFCLRTALT